jgi:tetratricopeptide (TPR) repeat protein
MPRFLLVVVAALFAVHALACSSSLPRTPRVQPSPSPAAAGPTLPDARRLYDSGRYNELVAAVRQVAQTAEPMPALVYLAARSLEKLGDINGAREMYQRLAGGIASGWNDIGRSALALSEGRLDDALMAAQSAARDGTVPEAYFQLGLVLMTRMDYEGAANAFETATMVDPTFAAAHYYAGLADSKVKRIDRMAEHFETFLRLAPDAPEEGEVQSIMRTVR